MTLHATGRAKCLDCGRIRTDAELGRERTLSAPIGEVRVRVCTDAEDCRAYAEREPVERYRPSRL